MEKHTLTKQEIMRIAQDYGLGKVKKSSEMNKGWVNFSYDVSADSGNYIIQILGDPYNAWKRAQMKLQFALLNHLQRKGFPYGIPVPIAPANPGKEFITNFSRGRHLWVYRKIEGNTPEKVSDRMFGEIVKGMATFHEYSRDFRWPTRPEWFYYEPTMKAYKKMARVKPTNKLNRLILEQLPFLEESIERLRRMRFGARRIIHADLNDDNVLFQGDRLVGIIDFDALQFAPLERDVAMMLKRVHYPYWNADARKIKLYAQEYRKHAKFSEYQEEQIPAHIMIENCTVFAWLYSGMKKHLDQRYETMKKEAEEARRMARLMGW